MYVSLHYVHQTATKDNETAARAEASVCIMMHHTMSPSEFCGSESNKFTNKPSTETPEPWAMSEAWEAYRSEIAWPPSNLKLFTFSSFLVSFLASLNYCLNISRLFFSLITLCKALSRKQSCRLKAKESLSGNSIRKSQRWLKILLTSLQTPKRSTKSWTDELKEKTEM